MIKTLRRIILGPLFILVLLAAPASLLGWGFWAHKEITKVAIESLPDGLRDFFRAHSDSLVVKSVEPDQRRFSDRAEPFRHYINFERYGSYPFQGLPHDYDKAVKKFGKGFVDSTGTILWRIIEFMDKLTESFKQRDAEKIVFFASYLGHYIADAHVPLHATENYDGQMTDQRGIHSRWESRIPEKFGSSFKLTARPAEYVEHPVEKAFEMILESFLKVDSVLTLDKQAQQSLPKKDRFVIKKNKNRVVYEYTDKYYERYQSLLNRMVERRMNDSARDIADYWLTAWVNAGKPEVSGFH